MYKNPFCSAFAGAFILFLSVMFSTSPAVAQQNKPAVESFKWLTGTWQHTEYGTYEFWAFSPDRKKLEGIGFRKNEGGGLMITEHLQITCEESDCYYIADAPENPEPTWFKIKSWNEMGFRSENSEHDFPKFIAYKLCEDGTMVANIGDNSRTISFSFEKIELSR